MAKVEVSPSPDRGHESGAVSGAGWPEVAGQVPWMAPDLGGWLVAGRRAMDGCEAAWLAGLAAFDRSGGWVDDGQLSCASWLMWRTGLARSTAFERLRVAHELSRRPVVAAALAEGRASYAMVRLMVRATGASPEVDESFVRVAEAGTVADVERAVRLYQLYVDQDRPLDERNPGRGLRVRDLGDGTARVEGVLTDVEAAELEVALRVFVDRSSVPGPSGGPEPVDESAQADWSTPRADPPSGGPTWAERRADALMELARAAVGQAATPAGDRYTLHLVVDHHRGCLLGRGPLAPDVWQRMACDCGTVVHHRDDKGAPLAVGRRHRTWSVAQRRAITVRDQGRCRWPGCEHTTTDVHHLLPWSLGGTTDVANGLLLCPAHHTRIHRGYQATGTAAGTVTFLRLDGTPIGATHARVG